MIDMKFLIAFLLSFFFVSTTNAEQYSFKVLRVVDGDTVEIEAPFLPKELKQSLLLRINGVHVPEKGTRAKCPEENMASLRAKLFVEQEISNGKNVLILIRSWDKYGGRILGDVLIDGIPLSQKLLSRKYAVPYNGRGKKKDWCA